MKTPVRTSTALRKLFAPEGRPRGILLNRKENEPGGRLEEENQPTFGGDDEEGIDGGDDDAPLRRMKLSTGRSGCDDGVPPMPIFRAE